MPRNHGPKTSYAEICRHWSTVWSVFTANSRCWGCGLQLPLSKAHLIAHADGGRDAPDNLVPACRHCNYAIEVSVQKCGLDRTVAWLRDNVTNRVSAPPWVMDHIWELWTDQKVPPFDMPALATQAHIAAAAMRTPFAGHRRES